MFSYEASPVMEVKEGSVARYRLSTRLVADSLQPKETGKEKLSFALAWSDPPLLEGLLDQQGLGYFSPDLLEAEAKERTSNLSKILETPKLFEKILQRPQDLEFLLKHPDFPKLLPPLLSQVALVPEALKKVLLQLGVEACIPLTGWDEEKQADPGFALRSLGQIMGEVALAEQFARLAKIKATGGKGKESSVYRDVGEYLAVTTGHSPAKPGWLERGLTAFLVGGFGNALTKTVLHVFLKQSPECQLRIILSLKNAPRLQEEKIEDCVHFELLDVGAAVYLQTDLPLLVDSEPEFYRPETLTGLSEAESPISRQVFTSKEIRPSLEWLNARADERFVRIVRKQLTDLQNARVRDQDILSLVQPPLLTAYVKKHALFGLMGRLDKLHPWEQEDVPGSVKLLRKQVGCAYFPPEKGWVASKHQIEQEIVNLEKLERASKQRAPVVPVRQLPDAPGLAVPAPARSWFSSCCCVRR